MANKYTRKSQQALLKKPEHLFLTKSDVVDEKELASKLAKLKKIDPKAIAISIVDDESMENVKKILNAIQAKK